MLKFYCSNSRWYLVVCMAHMCLYACLTALGGGLAPNEMTDGVLGYFLPDLDQDITDLQDRLRCNLAVPDGPKPNAPEVFYWI